MTEYSRTTKYKDLRERLQNDTDSETVGTNDLQDFQRMLNAIDSANFAEPEFYGSADHNATHARNVSMPIEPELHRTQSLRLTNKTAGIYDSNENDNSGFDSDYLDQYIREVKQYNIEQGNASTENTQVNILRQLQRNTDEEQPAPQRPYQRTRPASSNTTEIPFQQNRNAEDYFRRPQSAPVQPETSARQYAGTDMDTMDTMNDVQGLTKEDIMAEVQSLVNGTNRQSEVSTDTSRSQPSQIQESPFVEDDYFNDMGTDTFSRNIRDERLTNRKLLNETTQMRAQLDDYAENLNDVTDKMRHTNQVMNAVLIVIIAALLVILGVVIYFIVITRS